MRVLIIVKATLDSEAGVMPEEPLIAAMARYHEELAKAGVLVDASGLQPTAEGWRIRYNGGECTVINGSFTQSKDLPAGYILIKGKSRDEALEWRRRVQLPRGGRGAVAGARPEHAICRVRCSGWYRLADVHSGSPRHERVRA
jgi:hypothetical protein